MAQSTESPAPIEPRIRALLVDDEPANLLALEAILDDMGHDLVKVSSGEEALRQLSGSEFAIVLLDVQMRGLSGFETAERIRSRSDSRHIPIVFLTAYDSDRETVERAYSLGAVDFVVKPISPVILRAKVSGLVELYRKSQQIKRQAEELRQSEHRGFEQKLREENARLRESEARKAAILATALDCIITIDHLGRILEFNPAAERTFGYSRHDVLGRDMASLIVPPALRESHHQGLARFYPGATGSVLNRRIEMPALRSDGSEIQVELTIACISSESKPVFTAYLRDISERKNAERRRSARLAVTQALAQSPKLRDAAGFILSAMCDSLDWDIGLLWLVDPVDRILRCDASWRRPSVNVERFERASWDRTFGPGIGLPGRVWTSRMPSWIPDVGRDANFPRGPFAEQDGLHGAFGFPITHSAEVLGVMEFFSAAVREPDPDLLEMVATLGAQIGQFIERRQAEEALRESEQRFQRFMQYLPGLAWIKDLKGRYVYVNDAAERAFRIGRDRLYGSTDEEVFPPETAAKFRENDARALESGTDVQVIESLEHGDGQLHYSIVSKFPVMGSDGQAAWVGGMAIDITDRMRAEEALKEADRQKDAFLAMLSHELRNPLAPVRNALQIMKMPGVGPEVVRQSREMMERQIVHLVRLVDDLLDVSRIMRNRIELRKERLDLTTVFARGIETAQPAIDSQGHELSVSLPAQPIQLEGDLVRLAQVVSNLLVNAAKYTERAGRIWLSGDRDGDHAVIRVRDTGVGIDPELLSHIFDLFRQADRSLARSQGGLGIGLTLVKHLVELHGGAVSASSDGQGCGSEFVVRLPALPAAPVVLDNGTSDAAMDPSAVRHRMLVVDDNIDAAESGAILLRLLGHEVTTAHDGPSAIEAVRAFRPEVVLLDIGLPGMSGYEVAQVLRSQPDSASLKLIAVTGYGQDEDRRRSAESGFDRHMVKPLDQEALRSLLASLQAADGRPIH
jgi:PAS domain S-box-containing protein